MSSLTPHAAVSRDQGPVPDCILFFRMGDFYEMFFETPFWPRSSWISRSPPATRAGGQRALAGFPGTPLRSTSQSCMEGAQGPAIMRADGGPPGKGIVKREVVRVVTPGLVRRPRQPGGQAEQFPAGIAVRARVRAVLPDISTGEFRVTEIVDRNFFVDEVSRHGFREIVLGGEPQDAVLETALTRDARRLRDQPLPEGLVRSRRCAPFSAKRPAESIARLERSATPP